MSKVMTAVATPILQNKVDVESFGKLVSFQEQQGADALLVAGATGQGRLLSLCEKKLLVKVAKQYSNMPLWLGIDGDATRETVATCQWAEQLGVNGLMICPPAFCKCTNDGFVQHVDAIVKCTTLPLMLYNAPSRVGYNLPLNAVEEIAKLGVNNVKDAGEDKNYTQEISQHMTTWCGNEQKLGQFVSLGIDKVVSVVANLSPQLVKNAIDGKNLSQFEKVAQLTMQETNPVAVNYILYKMGIFATPELRLPLTKASKVTQKILDGVWQ